TAFAREFIVRLTLIALLVSGLLPAGWMPNPEGIGAGVPIVFCTGHGPITIAEHIGDVDHGKPVNPADSPTLTCVFAGATVHATPVVAPVLVVLHRTELWSVAPRAPPATVLLALYRPQSQRGPPAA